MKIYEIGIVQLVSFAIGAAIAGFCFDYVLFNVFGKDVPWYADIAAGIVAGAVTVPGAIVLWILKLCGVAMPLIG